MYKTHRQNHDFQIAYFLAGKCNTPDGAYALLCDLKDDREAAIANYSVNSKRQQAKEIHAKIALQSTNKATKLEAEADLEEIETARQFGRVLFEAATTELAFINSCMAKLEPLRKFKHLPLPQAHEAAQYDEWKLELMVRAENYLINQGVIPADEFATMRAHPAFASEIFPVILRAIDAVKKDNIGSILSGDRSFDPHLLLQGPEAG